MSVLSFAPADQVKGYNLDQVADLIVKTNGWLQQFWSKSHGWAPPETAEYLWSVRLDRQEALSKSLRKRVSLLNDPTEDGELILAWVNLGAMVEGTLALFIGIWLEAYRTDAHAILKKKAIIDPDSLTLDELRRFVVTTGRLSEEPRIAIGLGFEDEPFEMNEYVKHVRDRRNAIHAFKDRVIGTIDEFHEAVRKYYEFLRHMLADHEYPDEG